MTRSSRPHKTPNLSESVQRRLNMYALAASATGVSFLALASPSEARIVYTHAHKVIGPNSQFGVDLNHDGVTDFTLRNIYRSQTSYRAASLWAALPGGNAIEGTSSFIFHSAYALSHGAKIGAPKKFGGTMMEGESAAGGNIGHWAGATDRYLGVRFQDRGGRTHYGWARFTIRGTRNSRIVAILTGYAYETIPNQPIIAGRTKAPANYPRNASGPANPEDPGPGASLTGQVPANPQLATLGTLAMGACGSLFWRRLEI